MSATSETTTTAAATIDIRRAGPPDAEAVMQMVREIATHEGRLEYVRVTTERWAEMLARRDVIVLVAWRAGVALGYVSSIRRIHLWSERDVLALDDLYVREAARDGGLGRRLMATLARSYAWPDRLTVTWGMEPDNHGAQRFYRRLGASLRDKVLAGWDPAGYAWVLDEAQEDRG